MVQTGHFEVHTSQAFERTAIVEQTKPHKNIKYQALCSNMWDQDTCHKENERNFMKKITDIFQNKDAQPPNNTLLKQIVLTIANENTSNVFITLNEDNN